MPEVHVGVKCVVVRERTAAPPRTGDRVQHRRLDLDEAGGTEPAPESKRSPWNANRNMSRTPSWPQVELALAVADIGIETPCQLVTEAADEPARAVPRKPPSPRAHLVAYGRPRPSHRSSLRATAGQNSSKSGVRAASANNWMPPVQSRSSAKAILP